MATPQDVPVGKLALGLPRNGRDPGGRLAVVALIINGVSCAVPLDVVERAFQMVAVSPLPGPPSLLVGVINLHGSVVPVVDLCGRLGSIPHAYGLDAHLLLVTTPRRRLALLADRVVGVQTISLDSVVPGRMVAQGLQAISGIAAVSGGLLLIHDVEAVLSAEDEKLLDRALVAQ